jgi:predicted nucleic acid-binding protein
VIVVDTNVVSELLRPLPSSTVVDWMNDQPTSELFVTVITVEELWFSIARLPEGKRRTDLAARVEAVITIDLDHRIAPFDVTAAGHCADVRVRRRQAGRPITLADAQIAAICRSHGATLATRNVDDFTGTGVALVNPWSAW